MDHSYSVSEYSKSYRLTDFYRGKKLTKVNIQDERILQRLRKHKLKLVNAIPDGSEYEFLSNNLTKITINHSDAMNFIDNNFSNDPDIHNAYKISIDYIYEKHFFFKVDTIAGRCHTNITNLSRELRPFLRYKGKPLINIDISNSQPFLFNILIQNLFKRKEVKNYNSLNFGSFSNISNNPAFNSPYLVQFPDIALYEKLTSEGKFYEYVMKETGVELKDREKFKESFFGKVFFCKSKKHYTYKEAKSFRKLFPNVYSIILHYKKDDYTQLAINLQRAEADIMISKICKRISVEKPEMFICTIHDSILTTSENKSYICSVIMSEFEKNFNLKPSIKIE